MQERREFQRWMVDHPCGMAWYHAVANRVLVLCANWMTAMLSLKMKRETSSKARFEGLMEAVPAPVTGVDSAGWIILVNEERSLCPAERGRHGPGHG